MTRLAKRVVAALALHQQATAATRAAARLLRECPPSAAAADHQAEERALTAQLRSTAAALAPGWLDAPLDALAATTPLGGLALPTFVRVGQAHPLDDASFPVMVPFLGAGHIAVDADARDPRVSGLLRALTLRLLAAAPLGALRLRIVDSSESGEVLAAFRMSPQIPVATDECELRDLLSEAESWVANRPDDPHAPLMVLIIASLPELTDGRDLDRISVLAKAGPAGRLHIIAAGWPPPPLTAETTQRRLPYCTQITLRNPHAWVGDPPGASFAADGVGPGRLSAPVYLDHDPPLDLIRRVCEALSEAFSSDLAAAGSESAQPVVRLPIQDELRSAWQAYLLAAQRLAVVRSQATHVVAEQGAAIAVTMQLLASVQIRLNGQYSRIGAAGASAGFAYPQLVIGPDLPDPELMALAQMSGPRVAAAGALRRAEALIEAADTALGGVPADTSGFARWGQLPTGYSNMAYAVAAIAGMMLVLLGVVFFLIVVGV